MDSGISFDRDKDDRDVDDGEDDGEEDRGDDSEGGARVLMMTRAMPSLAMAARRGFVFCMGSWCNDCRGCTGSWDSASPAR